MSNMQSNSDQVPITKQRPWKKYLLAGCGSISLICVILVLGNLILGKVNDAMLSPRCFDKTLNRISGIDVPTVRVYRDLVGNTQVVAHNIVNEDICRFTASSYSDGFWPATSPNQRYVSFQSNLFVTKDEVISYIYIVDAIDGSYTRFTLKDSEDVISMSWTPDSNKLAYVTSYGSAGYWQTTYLNLITPQGTPIWRVSLGTENNYFYGHLQWVDDGQTLRYGHDEESFLGVPVSLSYPFWCTITAQGQNLKCVDQ